MKRLGIYIHIPFCLSKCRYCGFYSRGGADKGEMDRYAASLADDIKEYGKIYGKIPGRGCNGSGREDPALDGRDHAGLGCEDSDLDGRNHASLGCHGSDREAPEYTVDTVFIGGGTPSILPPGAVSSLMDSLRSAFDIEADAEITIESNPKTLTREKLLEYRRAGINRLSMGLRPLTTVPADPGTGPYGGGFSGKLQIGQRMRLRQHQHRPDVRHTGPHHGNLGGYAGAGCRPVPGAHFLLQPADRGGNAFLRDVSQR